jgi:hypothetical protein
MKSCIIQNQITGLFFDGTNFSAADATAAERFEVAPDSMAIRLVWGDNARVIEVTAEQWEKLELSDELTARANAQFEQGRKVGISRYAAPHFAACTRLGRRATAVACEVYKTFPKHGRACN